MIDSINRRDLDGFKAFLRADLAASGKKVETPFLSFVRLEDGKIAEMWMEWDNLNILSQLGHVPPS